MSILCQLKHAFQFHDATLSVRNQVVMGTNSLKLPCYILQLRLRDVQCIFETRVWLLMIDTFADFAYFQRSWELDRTTTACIAMPTKGDNRQFVVVIKCAISRHFCVSFVSFSSCLPTYVLCIRVNSTQEFNAQQFKISVANKTDSEILFAQIHSSVQCSSKSMFSIRAPALTSPGSRKDQNEVCLVTVKPFYSTLYWVISTNYTRSVMQFSDLQCSRHTPVYSYL